MSEKNAPPDLKSILYVKVRAPGTRGKEIGPFHVDQKLNGDHSEDQWRRMT